MRKPASRCGKLAQGGFSPAAFTPRFPGAKSLNDFLPAIARPAFERFGFSSAEILTNWPAYAGADIAAYTMPERLKWPRGGEAGGATLYLRVGGARALELQYKLPQLQERVNAAFGYRAVAAIRLVQAPLREKKPGAKRVTADECGAQERRLNAVADPKLRHALAVIAAGVAMRNDAGRQNVNAC